MKRLMTGALAALTLVGGLAGLGASAQAQSYDQGRYNQGGYDQGRYNQGGYDQGRSDQGRYGHDQYRHDNGGYDRGSSWSDRGRSGYGEHRHWSRGQYLPSAYRGHDRYVDYRRHHLRHPPRGYGWVRADNGDYLMIALATGLIASIAANQY